MPLSELQLRVGRVFRSTPGADAFALAGGGALAVLGIGDRETQDLDFFAEQSDTVDAFAPLFVRACQDAGLGVHQVMSSPGFRRFSVTHNHDRTLVDLSWDARIRAPHDSALGSVIDRDELAADKLLALFGRAFPRDFVDVYRLRAYYTREQLCSLAHEKDRGFNESILAQMIAKLASYARAEFPIDDATFVELRSEFRDWRRKLGLQNEPPTLPHSRPPPPEPPTLDL